MTCFLISLLWVDPAAGLLELLEPPAHRCRADNKSSCSQPGHSLLPNFTHPRHHLLRSNSLSVWCTGLLCPSSDLLPVSHLSISLICSSFLSTAARVLRSDVTSAVQPSTSSWRRNSSCLPT